MEYPSIKTPKFRSCVSKIRHVIVFLICTLSTMLLLLVEFCKLRGRALASSSYYFYCLWRLSRVQLSIAFILRRNITKPCTKQKIISEILHNASNLNFQICGLFLKNQTFNYFTSMFMYEPCNCSRCKVWNSEAEASYFIGCLKFSFLLLFYFWIQHQQTKNNQLYFAPPKFNCFSTLLTVGLCSNGEGER